MMTSGAPSGFHNAPVTRTFVIACAILSIILGFQNGFQNLGLSYQDIFRKPRIWRLIASVFAFSSTPELIFGLTLLYYFRIFERQIGSNKHLVFILFSVIVSSIFEFLALAYLGDPSTIITSGPYCLIFASFVPFYLDIPISSRIRVYGVQFSDKSFVYLAGLQLLFSSWKQSLIPGICGMLAGSLYRLNFLYIRSMKFPDTMLSTLSRLSWPSSAISAYIPLNTTNSESSPERRTEANNASGMEVASEAYVATLVSMGFDSVSARQALLHAGNDITVATNILLEAQSH